MVHRAVLDHLQYPLSRMEEPLCWGMEGGDQQERWWSEQEERSDTRDDKNVCMYAMMGDMRSDSSDWGDVMGDTLSG